MSFDLGSSKTFETKDEKAKLLEKEANTTYELADPFRKLGILSERKLSALYNTFHASGVGFIVSLWWFLYPRWCCYRHLNLKRYTKPQIQFRHRYFSVNIPKVVNPSERRGVVLVMGSLVAIRWMNSSMTFSNEAPQEAYDAIRK